MHTLKKIISYFFEIKLQNIESIQSGRMTISLHKGQLKLSTEKVIYSYGKNYGSFKYAFKKTNVENLNIKKVLILGAGLGSIIQLLENNKNIEKIVAIDNDAVIIKAAKEYLKSSLNEKTFWQQVDAFEFIKTNSEKFDLILFDVFVHEITPSIFLTDKFLQLVKSKLNQSGILVFSKMDTDYKLKEENKLFEKQFSAIFPKNTKLTFSGNKLLIGYF